MTDLPTWVPDDDPAWSRAAITRLLNSKVQALTFNERETITGWHNRHKVTSMASSIATILYVAAALSFLVGCWYLFGEAGVVLAQQLYLRFQKIICPNGLEAPGWGSGWLGRCADDVLAIARGLAALGLAAAFFGLARFVRRLEREWLKDQGGAEKEKAERE